MTKLIRDCDSLLYLTFEGGWTDDPDKAWPMSSITDAEKIANHLGLENIEVYFAFGDADVPTAWDFAIPLHCGAQRTRREPTGPTTIRTAGILHHS